MVPLPFALAEYETRLTKIRREMPKRGLDLLIVNDVANQHYITAYDGWSFYTPQMVLVPAAGEPVWIKRASSAFFGTPIIPFLTAARVDTLIVTGCVTSGCIRATTVDAVSFGYRTIVPVECVGDRAEGPHKWNLFDIDAKYADVESLPYVLSRVAALSSE